MASHFKKNYLLNLNMEINLTTRTFYALLNGFDQLLFKKTFGGKNLTEMTDSQYETWKNHPDRKDMFSLEDVSKLTYDQLINFRGIGKKGLAEINSILIDNGYSEIKKPQKYGFVKIPLKNI